MSLHSLAPRRRPAPAALPAKAGRLSLVIGFCLLAAAALAALALLAAGCSRVPKGPTIVLVVLDTVRRDYTGPAAPAEDTAAQPGAPAEAGAAADATSDPGGAGAAAPADSAPAPTPASSARPARAPASFTPTLDRLAAEGTCYTQAWANAPWTVPSHASLFTGLLPGEHGCATADPRLKATLPTVAELLLAHGYRTAAFYSNPWLADRTTNLLRGFGERYEAPIGSLHELVSPFGDQGGRNVLALVSKWLDAYDGRRPCFVFVNFLEAHLPYDPPADYRRAHLADLPPGDKVSIQWGHEYSAGLHPPQFVDWERVRRLYGGDVNTADRLLDGLVQLLQRRGLYDDCVLIVTSDHGENLGDHGLVEHQFSVHESVLGVPLVVRAPASALAKAGRGLGLPSGRVATPVELIDLFPTILELAGAPAPAPGPAHARSLLSGAPARRPLIAEYDGPGPGLLGLLRGLNPNLDATALAPALRTLRRGDWRVTVSSAGDRWLHHLPSDPGQARDLAARHPRGAASLDSLLVTATGRGTVAPAGAAPLDEEARRRLRALGYVR
jgi:arylsulfatase A-like enzyme